MSEQHWSFSTILTFIAVLLLVTFAFLCASDPSMSAEYKEKYIVNCYSGTLLVYSNDNAKDAYIGNTYATVYEQNGSKVGIVNAACVVKKVESK
jgi:hypothetical protein